MSLEQPWFEWPGFSAVVSALGKNTVRVVGGAVRDSLLGLPVNDVDLATTHTPDQVIKFLQIAHIKVIPTGIAHGTVTAVIEHHAFEITTLREDVVTDGRHATVAFTDNWQTDAARRDFTINALSMDCAGKVYDYFGGRDDLQSGRVRFIGEPVKRIEEDALRILRFFRFSARYSSGIFDRAGLAACSERANSLMALSRERIRDELMKTLAADNPLLTVDAMIEHGIFKAFAPEVASTANLATVLAGEELVADRSALRRLSSLLPHHEPTCEAIAIRLKLSSKERKRLVAMAENKLAGQTLNHRVVRKLIYKLGKDGFINQLILYAPSKVFYDQAHKWEVPNLPITGGDLIALGVAPGPEVSHLLANLEAAWVEADFPAKRDVVINMARDMIKLATHNSVTPT